MFVQGDYGEFFPPSLSSIPYNISVATSYSGYDNIEIAKKYGYDVEEIKETIPEITEKVIKSIDLPKDIKNVTDDILQAVIFDQENKKYFRIIRPELDFYRQHNLPLPRINPFTRLSEKRKRFGTIVFELYNRSCPQCGNNFQTSYAPDRPEIVYCEQCYQQEVV
ncbi:hypothetical protein HY061_02505 [Candidatus Azambacteria bacterium]|nr:hypothetical protein [Candidatus Azambacteria bacterium]